MRLEDPSFPPLLTGHAVKSPMRPFEEACRRAASGELGAGDVVWSRGTADAAGAIVLEPEVPLRTAMQMAPLLHVALGDCLGALLPPQSTVLFLWPDTILLNGAQLGTTRIAAAHGRPDATPEWLVAGFSVRLRFDRKGREPGADPTRTALAEEGAGALDRTQLLQSTAAYFLSWLDRWQDEGFRPVGEQWLARAEGREHAVDFQRGAERVRGCLLGFDDEANLMVKPDRGPTRTLPLMDVLEGCAGERASS